MAEQENIEQLKEHLRIACMLEDNAYTYQEIYNGISRRIYSLQCKQFYCDSALGKQNEYIYGQSSKAYVNGKSKLSKKTKIIITIVCVLLLLPMLGGGLLMLIYGISEGEMATGIMMLFFYLLHAILPIALIALVALLVIKSRKKTANKSFKIEKVNHDKQFQESEYQKNLNIRYIEQYSQILTTVSGYLNEAKQKCEKHYSKNILYYKYRNYCAVTAMYDWLCSGRCICIKGNGGLYDKYELLLEHKEIVTELSEIKRLQQENNRKLDVVIANQGFLIDLMKSSNQIAYQILNSTQRIEGRLDASNIIQSDINHQLQSINQRQSWY
ncbi:MAG: hypothetical protein NC213_06135 [Acetobacter sp.]|nr:hypothetical protein [Bacteroides sp.]MCM1341305.1 hypothetical protein [Acetobacter sp.]MCM1433919.1 hypothetical protein [Clostridiales bacterium]